MPSSPVSRRAGLLAALALAAAGLASCSPSDPALDGADPAVGMSPTSPTPSIAAPEGRTGGTAAERASIRVVAVGDVVCEPGQPVTPTTCQHEATADLTERIDPDLVVGLGDLQYEEGTPEQFDQAWDASWGRFADRIVTVPGNHEWRSDLTGWRETFGSAVPSALRVGAWGIYLLDGTCDRADCTAQADWLRDRLAEDTGRCQLVAWHQPRVSSGIGEDPGVVPQWRAAVEGGADIVLSAHDHLYERFTRLDADAAPAEVGAREFVVGTGGKSLYEFAEVLPGSEARTAGRFGVLQLTLDPTSYAWRFVATATDGDRTAGGSGPDGQVLDAGDDLCR